MILTASFEYEITKTHDTGVIELRCNAISIDGINTWVDEFGKLNNTHWNFRSGVPNGTRIVCSNNKM
ncbi:Uncharacterized protein FWK35_00010319 [Aphis craccivora]|uniref:Uncharacterized protein n=1 Tax=Aphis craccivora TaxID=307492 RepID=A0A6G0YGW9_APHCR|nr:Uncharacterized protein FWK35_00010319 [Aphis craccivora]